MRGTGEGEGRRGREGGGKGRRGVKEGEGKSPPPRTEILATTFLSVQFQPG